MTKCPCEVRRWIVQRVCQSATDLPTRPGGNGRAGRFVSRTTVTFSAPYWSGIFGRVFVVTQDTKIVFEASRPLVKHADTEHVSGRVKLGVEVPSDASVQPADTIESRIGSTGSGVTHRLYRRHDPPAPIGPPAFTRPESVSLAKGGPVDAVHRFRADRRHLAVRGQDGSDASSISLCSR